jgi:hypothetical protein
MATPLPTNFDTVTVASAATGIAVSDHAAANATLQAAAAASRQRAVGAVTAAGAPAGTATGATAAARLNPSISPPSVTGRLTLSRVSFLSVVSPPTTPALWSLILLACL